MQTVIHKCSSHYCYLFYATEIKSNTEPIQIQWHVYVLQCQGKRQGVEMSYAECFLHHFWVLSAFHVKPGKLGLTPKTHGYFQRNHCAVFQLAWQPIRSCTDIIDTVNKEQWNYFGFSASARKTVALLWLLHKTDDIKMLQRKVFATGCH